ncbi:hypothetical protein HanRHA438_Chr07g0288571 [Helianthus annuus]|nr:hypothetical protein HanHA300_Chr07g0228751 [Helianthus annuus]KAJ0561925.1 hypothetical protein HanHA89_Chr07g0245471 [Helianthus annuus]KAJ0906540.1 hypothetical protein HanRHA438_Chr07g0288571 [Helianthus annuus]
MLMLIYSVYGWFQCLGNELWEYIERLIVDSSGFYFTLLMKNLLYGSPLGPSYIFCYRLGRDGMGWFAIVGWFCAWKGGLGLGVFIMRLCVAAFAGILFFGAGLGWDVCRFGGCCWAGFNLGWAGVIRGWLVGPIFSYSWCYWVACLLSFFVWTLGCIPCVYPPALPCFECRSHMVGLCLVCVLGINTNMGVIRQDRFGRMSFRWYPYLLPTPEPNPIGTRNRVNLFFFCDLCLLGGMGLSGWVWHNRWTERRSLHVLWWWLVKFCYDRVMLLDLNRPFDLYLSAAESWIHHVGSQNSNHDHYTPQSLFSTVLCRHVSCYKVAGPFISLQRFRSGLTVLFYWCYVWMGQSVVSVLEPRYWFTLQPLWYSNVVCVFYRTGLDIRKVLLGLGKSIANWLVLEVCFADKWKKTMSWQHRLWRMKWYLDIYALLRLPNRVNGWGYVRRSGLLKSKQAVRDYGRYFWPLAVVRACCWDLWALDLLADLHVWIWVLRVWQMIRYACWAAPNQVHVGAIIKHQKYITGFVRWILGWRKFDAAVNMTRAWTTALGFVQKAQELATSAKAQCYHRIIDKSWLTKLVWPMCYFRYIGDCLLGWGCKGPKIYLGHYVIKKFGPPPVFGLTCNICWHLYYVNINAFRSRFLYIPRVGFIVSYFWSPETCFGRGHGGMPLWMM